jgi:hypothetical protein
VRSRRAEMPDEVNVRSPDEASEEASDPGGRGEPQRQPVRRTRLAGMSLREAMFELTTTADEGPGVSKKGDRTGG